jgi:hypothetical protein
MEDDRLILSKLQESRKSTYQSHECSQYLLWYYPQTDCGTTDGIDDPTVGQAYCGITHPEQNICLKPDRHECFIGYNAIGINPLETITWDQTAPQIKCVYNTDFIDTIEQLKSFKSKWPLDEYNNLMKIFCNTKTSRYCARGINGACSKYNSLDKKGSYCKTWLSELSPEQHDEVISEFCLANDTDDCKCLNRSQDEKYTEMKTHLKPYSDNCWFKPCANAQSYFLVPKDLSNKDCPSTLCENIIDVLHTNGNVDISGNSSNVNCTTDHLEPFPKQSIFHKFIFFAFISIIIIIILKS